MRVTCPVLTYRQEPTALDRQISIGRKKGVPRVGMQAVLHALSGSRVVRYRFDRPSRESLA